MSEALDDMDAYIQLTDEVFQRILHYTEPDDKLEKVAIQFYGTNLLANWHAHQIWS